LTAWNGLMMASFAEAGIVLDRSDYTDAARRNAEFVLAQLKRDDLLLRSWKEGVAKFNAYLEDYAFLIEGLVTLYETTGESRWLKESLALTDRLIVEFWDSDNGGFFFTGKNHESLIVRSKDYFDNATPSGNSVAAIVLLRLATLTDNDNYRNHGIAVLREIGEAARRYPSAFGYALSAADFLLSTPKEVAIVGKNAEDIQPLVRQVWSKYLPNKVVAPSFDAEPVVPLLENRGLLDSKATAYVCVHYTCKQPVTDVTALAEQLATL
jgi:uncharacterized protein YyaL (SSP411 family)